MRAAWIEAGAVQVVDRPSPEPAPEEALVRVLLAGVCGTDLELLSGYKAFTGIPGHEFVGLVEHAPSAPALVGRRVVGAINVGCGACAACEAEGAEHCAGRRVLGISGLGGAMAEHLVLPVANLHVVEPDTTNERAVFAEPLAAACRVLDQIPPVEGRRAIVVGAGRLGSLVAQILRLSGASVEAVVRSTAGRDWLRATGVQLVSADDVSPGADVVVDCTGNPEALPFAATLVRPRGHLVLKSTCARGPGSAAIDLNDLVVRELTLVGSRCGPIETSLAHLSRSSVVTAPLVEATYALDDVAAAFAHAARPGTGKILVAPARS